MSLTPKLMPKITEPSELVDKFTKLYCDLIPTLYNVESRKFLADVKLALKDMRRLKYNMNERHENEFYIDIKYEESPVRCAYMYAYSILNTAVVYSEFSKHLMLDKETFNFLFSDRKFKICCLAGGPAFEATGISKSIFDFINKFSNKSNLFTNVEVTVIDIVSQWDVEGEALINSLNKSTNLFDSKTINFHHNFLNADLLSPFDEALKQIISEAHIVTVVKFGSSIEERTASVCVSSLGNMIKNVTDCMRDDSCLFMLDVSGSKMFKHTMNVVSNQKNKHTLQVSLHKKYRLLPKTLQKMESCLNFRNISEASTLFPTVLTTISSCFWIKKSTNI